MSPEEAIKECKKIDTYALPEGYLGKMEEALNMAIEALEHIKQNRADLEFLNWCFEDHPDEMQKLVHKYSKDGLWQY